MLRMQGSSLDPCSFRHLQPPQAPAAVLVGVGIHSQAGLNLPGYEYPRAHTGSANLPLPFSLPPALCSALLIALRATRILLSLLRLGALGGGTAEVVWDPRLVVVPVNAAGDAGGFIAGEGLGHINDLLALLLRQGGLLCLGEEGLDPGLVDEVESAGKGAGQEQVEENAVT